MNKQITAIALTTIMASVIFLTGCTPVVKDEIKEIAPNETAFLIKLDVTGDGKDIAQTQSRFQSEDFLKQSLIASKRVIIPHKLIDTCHNCIVSHEWQDVAEFRLVTINRAPVTREWTSSSATGTSLKNQAFHVETNESIDFAIGANVTAHISEEDATKFLYHYGGKQLEEVIDQDVRGFISSSLSQQFGAQSLDYARNHKVDIFDKAFIDAKKNFANFGITIDRVGFTEGMTYTDSKIQTAINNKFEADMNVEISKKTLEAAETNAKSKEAVKAQQDQQVRMMELDIEKEKVKKWNGVNSTTVVYGNNNNANGGSGVNINVK